MTRRTKTALYWIAGIATSFAGVAIVRLIAPLFAEKTAAILGAAGHVIALAGLVVIAFGVRQRVWAQGAENSEPPPSDESEKTEKSDRPGRSDISDRSDRSD